ncbi:MAG: hypothetical protein KF901_17320 [Myxococcales bacterium]|nr:hypothetical protein [Myxococcales bacterium]
MIKIALLASVVVALLCVAYLFRKTKSLVSGTTHGWPRFSLYATKVVIAVMGCLCAAANVAVALVSGDCSGIEAMFSMATVVCVCLVGALVVVVSAPVQLAALLAEGGLKSVPSADVQPGSRDDMP